MDLKWGAVSFSTNRFGQADDSVELSGSSEYITVAHDSKLILDNLTISAWVKILFKHRLTNQLSQNFNVLGQFTNPITIG